MKFNELSNHIDNDNGIKSINPIKKGVRCKSLIINNKYECSFREIKYLLSHYLNKINNLKELSRYRINTQKHTITLFDKTLNIRQVIDNINELCNSYPETEFYYKFFIDNFELYIRVYYNDDIEKITKT